ncbi:CehA/McbA family metallohydrolase domain-containing protein [Allokutzneria albata]|uniref:Polymerase/histidinol phosphatase N-terminal domain-containing protein n=1 Tax=Allokutzneria albata TaxID=211114 RepID=A0A1G9T739_ALLAB|nr:hypothetical protein [Allokutzneria albata]SDM43468.1 hypothetical protein SAMN04489726_1600 [Allokutzneria albata]
MSPVGRRAVLLGAAAAIGTAGLPLSTKAAPGPSSGALSPVTMAMHLHASFSEGVGSMAGHLDQATKLGVDVVWWTDHDFRLMAHGYRTAVGFDGMEETQDGRWWRWAEAKQGTLGEASGRFVAEPRSPDEPGKALALKASGDGTLWYTASAWNSTYNTSLADTTLSLDVLAEQVGPDAQLVVDVLASHHPATGGRPAGQYRVEYRIGGVNEVQHSANGLVGTVRLPVPRGRWTRLEFTPVQDIAALWPDLNAADNSLLQLRIGVRSARNTPSEFVVDRLRIARARRAGDDALALRQEIMDRNAKRFPDVVQRSALEVSLTRHLNWFGEKVVLPDYSGKPPVKDPSEALAKQMVAFIHSHGGLASYNHPLEGELNTPQKLAEALLAGSGLGGVDIVEIGCGMALPKLLHVLDVSARNALFFTGTGVSDDHAGKDWVNQKTNWITGVWAGSAGTADLLGSLRAGRAWFTDPKRWRGSLEATVNGASAMGGGLLSSAKKVPLTVTVTDAPADGRVELVTGVVDYAGAGQLDPATTSRSVRVSELTGGRWNLDVEPGEGSFVRSVVRDGAGEVVGVGNPTWLLSRPPAGGVPRERALPG